MLQNSKRRAADDRGFALLLVLGALLLASLLAFSVANDTWTGMALVRNRVDSAQAEALADAGVHDAAFRLLTADPENGQPPYRYRLTLPGGEVEIEIEDEDGKIDLNVASEELFQRLFAAAGLDLDVAISLAQELIKFRAGEAVSPWEGMEGVDGLGLEEHAGDASLASVIELRQLPGVSQPLFERLESAVTVVAQSDGLDPAAATALAMMALPDMTIDTAERLMSGESTDDIGGLDAAEPFILLTRQSLYTIRAIARIDESATFVRIALVELMFDPDEPFIIYDWRQGAAPSEVAEPK